MISHQKNIPHTWTKGGSEVRMPHHQGGGGGDTSITDTFHMRVYNWQKSRIFYSIIRCEKSQCTPAENGPTNACQYICGEDKCDGKHLEPVTLEEILAGETYSSVFQKLTNE